MRQDTEYRPVGTSGAATADSFGSRPHVGSKSNRRKQLKNSRQPWNDGIPRTASGEFDVQAIIDMPPPEFPDLGDDSKVILTLHITEAEANGKHFVLLGRYESGVPSEVIFEAAKKIKGLKPVMKRSFTTDEHPTGAPVYYIEWDSTDPNDHRNDK